MVCLAEECPVPCTDHDYAADPQGIRAKGYRFIVRGADADWMQPWRIRPGDVDVTDINDEEELATIFARERNKASLHNVESTRAENKS